MNRGEHRTVDTAHNIRQRFIGTFAGSDTLVERQLHAVIEAADPAGGALELAMCCDMRCCSDTSTFAAVEARFSNGIATMIMPWLIGQRCRALLYTGDAFDSSEAFRLGLVDKVFPKAALQAEVTKIAKRKTMWWYKGVAKVAGQVVAEAEVGAMISDA